MPRIPNSSMVLLGYESLGVAAKAQVATGERYVKRVLGGNGTSTLYYLQVHNTVGEPAGGAVPAISIPVGIGVAESPTENERAFGIDFMPFPVGVYVAWSSTMATYTAVTPAVHYAEVDYV